MTQYVRQYSDSRKRDKRRFLPSASVSSLEDRYPSGCLSRSSLKASRSTLSPTRSMVQLFRPPAPGVMRTDLLCCQRFPPAVHTAAVDVCNCDNINQLAPSPPCFLPPGPLYSSLSICTPGENARRCGAIDGGRTTRNQQHMHDK